MYRLRRRGLKIMNGIRNNNAKTCNTSIFAGIFFRKKSNNRLGEMLFSGILAGSSEQ